MMKSDGIVRIPLIVQETNKSGHGKECNCVKGLLLNADSVFQDEATWWQCLVLIDTMNPEKRSA